MTPKLVYPLYVWYCRKGAEIGYPWCVRSGETTFRVKHFEAGYSVASNDAAEHGSASHALKVLRDFDFVGHLTHDL